MGIFVFERLIFACCWTYMTSRCENYTCCYTFGKCKNFVNLSWKIHRYRHYHKAKSKYPTTLAEIRKKVNRKKL